MDFARVFFEVPLDHGFDYRIPAHLKHQVKVGARVLAPFGSGKKLGYVVELLNEPAVGEVKEILDLPDEYPIFSQELLRLAQWISFYYFCPLGLVLKTLLTAPVRKFYADASKDLATSRPNIGVPTLEAPHLLNEEQEKGWEKIREKIQDGRFSVTLIHGVTGSGKTELYLASIQEILNRGKSAIVLVPEISLTPQTIERVRNRFGETVALLHSRMRERERLEEWRRIYRSQARVVVGPRSAIFAPVQDLGLIVVDEEHERSYKQEESPRYHARDVAIMRAKFNHALVLLGTATPALETYYNAQHGRYDLVTLTKRVEDRPLPRIKVVDMRREAESYGRLFNISRSVMEGVRLRLDQKEQVILFLNRRGYAPLVLCPSCGHVLTCSQCDQAMSYHRTEERLLCHLCDVQASIPKACPKCAKPKLHRLGVGTQRIEAHLEKLFPQAKIQRMDTDSTRVKDAHQKIFESLVKGEIEVLVGTQMVAKGLDLPNVTLVGVMSADVAMSLPDFRMGEHTFQLLTQVAGRAGRGEKLGEVLVQTFTPFHPVIRAAVDQDYLRFYNMELELRHQLGYPPFFRLVSILIEGKTGSRVVQVARGIVTELRSAFPSSARIMGPQPAPISRLKGKFRWQVIIFYSRTKPIHEGLKRVLCSFKEEKGIKIGIDVDPVTLL